MDRRTALVALVSTFLARVPISEAAQKKAAAAAAKPAPKSADPAKPTPPKPHPAFLTVPLDQWSAISFTHKGQRLTISVKEVFDVLKETQK